MRARLHCVYHRRYAIVPTHSAGERNAHPPLHYCCVHLTIFSVCARVPVVTRCRVSREACYALAPRSDVLCQTIDTIGTDGQK